jgi:antirestriction protein ArdC
MTTTRPTTRTPKADCYQTITDAIVARLESGDVAPWHKPWKGGAACRPLRHNGQPYSGINVLWLWMTAETAGYSSPFWMTYNQARELGGHVRKGEKGTSVVYAGTFEKTEQNAAGDDVTRRIPFLKTYTVFNAQQCDELPAHFAASVAPLPNPEAEPIAAAMEFFANTGADIRHGGGRAYYNPNADFIQVPECGAFDDAGYHAATLAHELAHWTGHASRLARDFSGRFGDNAYAAEELIAELAAAFLAADLGIEAQPRDDHAEYIAAWLRLMKADKRAIFTAAAAANRAAAFLHSLQPGGANVAAEEAAAEELEPVAAE